MSPFSDPSSGITTVLKRIMAPLLASLESTCLPETLRRGRSYEAEGRVKIVALHDNKVRAEVVGVDEAPYEVSIGLEESARSTCNCSEWGSWDDHCKHVAALVYALEKVSRGDVSHRILALTTPCPVEPAERKSVPDLDEVRQWLGVGEQTYAFTYDLEIRNGIALGIARSDRARGARWAQVATYLKGSGLSSNDRKIFAALEGVPRDASGRYFLSSGIAGGLLEALSSSTVTHAGKRLSFAVYPAHFFGEVRLEETHHIIGLRLRQYDGVMVALESVQFLSETPVWALIGTTLQKIQSSVPLEQIVRWKSRPELRLAREASGAIDFALGRLRQLGIILDAGGEIASIAPVFVLSLDGDGDSAKALLAVRYDDVELPLTMAGAATHVTTDGRLLSRDVAAEKKAVETLLQCGLAHGNGAFVAKGDRAVEFWTRGVQGVPSDWIVYGPKPSQVVKLRSLTPHLALTQSPTGWFTLEIAFAETDQSIDLARLRPLLISGRRYVPLSDGSVGELPREIAEYMRAFLEETGVEPNGGTVELAPYEAGEVERLIGLVPDAMVAPDARRFLAALRDFHGIESVEVPTGLKADLRPYQQRGLDWLLFLHRNGMSGVLADDMGLGKTIQALALFLRIKKDEGKKTNLVIAPTSVLTNWQREAGKFAPSLKVVMYDGPDREKKRESLSSYDLVLASYAILRRDAEILKKIPFRYVVLDEAQHVKNPASAGAIAARSLSSERRLALTGTPLENRLFDLWSLFHFLMPGFLGTETQYRNRYVRPIEVDGNAGVRDRLRRRVHPFILRRLKDEVARDLPSRTDTILPVELSPGQQALYREMLKTANERVQSIIAQVGFKKARISILTELLRLRQVCCDPRLLKLPPGTRLPPSSKLDAFGELVRDILGEGHRALVFSQFTEMLEYLTNFADDEGIRYEYLDGSTPSMERQERIDRFNAKDGPPLFFLSLKAGGTGLNLTAADYVIHYDPWWNPAVEQQAIDRTHRIGQTKPVFSYKLITMGTVEEKMLGMQERKKGLASGILSSDDAIGKVISEKDIEALFT